MRELGENDFKQLDALEIKESVLENQLALFNKGIKPIELSAAAQIDSGIVRLTDDLQNKYINLFEGSASELKITRFVPASGAASRMFKAFFQFLDDGSRNEEIITFSKKSKLFPFYNEICCEEEEDLRCSINNMINKLKLAELPKALIPFHSYKEDIRTAFEEHLVEAAMIVGDSKSVNLHFTISNSHQAKFEELLQRRLDHYTNKLNSNFDITFSYQLHSTDTIAVTITTSV
jgi:hypothetical protein